VQGAIRVPAHDEKAGGWAGRGVRVGHKRP
jgi:hypothetical protein